jgi:alkylation response protein AidB-like acyl-CoA dehydrogenase
MIARARELRTKIESYSEEADRICRMPDGLARIFKDEGIFNMSRPLNRGGMAMDLITTMRVVEEISIADASAGWCAAIGSGSIGTIALREDAAAEVYKPGTCQAGVGSPSGRARVADSGYILNGRWAYASGCTHSEWIFLGNVVMDGDKPRTTPSGAPDFRVAVVPMSSVEVLETWQVSGLRGTGSHDVVATDLFVPEEFTNPVALSAPSSNEGPSAIPMFTLFGIALVPVALGAARRAIDEVIDMAKGKTPMLSASKLGEKPVAQHEIARAEAMLQAARAYLYNTVQELQEVAASGQPVTMEMRGRVKLACVYATHNAADAAQIAYRVGGGAANYERSPLQRCLRDVNAVTQHFVVAASNYENAGRVLMGLDPGTPII